MSRFADWRAKRRSTSSPTVPAARWRPGSNGVARPATLTPATDSRLSDGVVVQTHLVARLLGLRILRVDGVVHVAPARLEALDAGVPAPKESQALGSGLVRASRLLDDGDRRLR
jgi:hypothetical protein